MKTGCNTRDFYIFHIDIKIFNFSSRVHYLVHFNFSGFKEVAPTNSRDIKVVLHGQTLFVLILAYEFVYRLISPY